MSVNRKYTHFVIKVLIAGLLCGCTHSEKKKFDIDTLTSIPDLIKYERNYDGHLQGIATDFKNYLFWSHTTQLVKTDLKGTVLKVIDVPTHHGDLDYYKGKIYVAVNLGKFNEEAGQEDSWVYVYEPENLELLHRYPVSELVHGAGGIAIHKKQVMIVGGLPYNGKYDKNFVYEYDLDFKFRKRFELSSGYTHLGIQTACYFNDHWYFGCYGSDSKNLKPVVLKVSANGDKLELVKTYDVDMSYGLIGLEKDKFLYSNKSLDKMAAKIKLTNLN
jgi:hypothetical protein